MQYYNLKTVTNVTPAQAFAIGEISARAADTLTKVSAGSEWKVGYRVAALNTVSPSRMIVDVDLGSVSLPIDLGAWAFEVVNHQRAAACVMARVREIMARRDAIVARLTDLRSRVEAVLATASGGVGFVSLRYWPTQGSSRLNQRELRLELEVEQFDLDLTRVRESYHGYGIRDLTSLIRRDSKLQQRIGELRQLLEEAGVEPTLDGTSQAQLVEAKASPAKMAKRIISKAREAEIAIG